MKYLHFLALTCLYSLLIASFASAAPIVTSTGETAAVASSGDAADDVCIWVAEDAPERSVIIGTDKQAGLAVYDLSGALLFDLPLGACNNVDLRYGFPLGTGPADIVVTGNRTGDVIEILALDPETRALKNVAARTLQAGITVYGSCMYRSAASGDYFVFVNSPDGAVEQWRLVPAADGKVDAERVRSFQVGSTTEGCVADDELGWLYIAEEETGIWKYPAEPAAEANRVLVDSIALTGRLAADVEGLALYCADDETGYLIASSQGNDTFAVYKREGGNEHLFSFGVGESGGIDAVTHTDGIEVTSVALGDAFPQGLFVAQDDANDGENQNFKLVPWEHIAEAAPDAPLTMAQGRNPRRHIVHPAAPKNVIVMIADGCGFEHVRATNAYATGELEGQVYESSEFAKLALSTYPNGGEYDPERFWSDFGYRGDGATDSAAAATAMATGHKTTNGVIGLDPDGKRLLSVTERAESLGKATGVVTTVPLSHATPAGFTAHNEARGNYAEITQEMILDSQVDVIMGAGHPEFDDDGRRLPVPRLDSPKALSEWDEQHRYVGGAALWRALRQGNVGGDADGDGEPDRWVLVESRRDFQRLAEDENPAKRVLGVMYAHGTAQQERTALDKRPKDDAPYETPRKETVPTLAEMSLGALNVLSRDEDGLFLMIEGGAVDWAGHDNQLGRMIEEMQDFNSAVDAVCAWVEEHSNWDETLLVITADHETGHLSGLNEARADEWISVVPDGKGNMPQYRWNSGSHTNSLVPFYTRGKAAAYYQQRADQTDPKRGPYLDNTDLPQVIFALWR